MEHKSKIKSGKNVAAKVFSAQVQCECRLKCAEKIDVHCQKSTFDKYYSMKQWAQKTLYLRSLVDRKRTKENLNPIISHCPKNFTSKYHLTDTSGIKHQVCLSFLSKCLRVSIGTIKNIMKNAEKNPEANERRGKVPAAKYKERDLDYVRQFIKSFPATESHYKTTKSNKKYLSPFMNMRRMYKEYKLKCGFKKLKHDRILPEWKFREIFNTEFNLSFARLKVDTCRKCDAIKAKLASNISASKRVELEEKRKLHEKIVEKNKRERKKIIEDAKVQESKTEVLTFDLQKALAVPCISTCDAYYKRQLWVYNLCIYDEVRGIGYMHVWDESIASRGAQEIGSCLLNFLMNNLPHDTEKLILYSDTCGGQNRNIKMTMILKHLLAEWKHPALRLIEQRYFVSGHSYNACDRCFATIEKQRRITEQIFVPEHWYNLIAQAKKNEPKFIVIKMKQNNFYSSKQLEQLIVNRKKSVDGKKISWLKFETIIYSRDNPFSLCVKEYSAEENSPSILISLSKKKTGDTFPNIKLEHLYDESRAISAEKYKDLNQLIQYIPDQYHKFYKLLKHKTNAPTLTDEDDDFYSDNEN